MKRRIRPITDLRDESMLDRIIMNIIRTPGIIAVIADLMLPRAPLPQGQAPAAYVGMPIDLPTADAGPSGRHAV
jgi:hypothetical protein